MEAQTTSVTTAPMEAQDGLGRRIQCTDRYRLLRADIDTDAAARAAVRIETIGIRVDMNDPVGTESRASVATGASLWIYMRRMQTESAIVRFRDQPARRYEIRHTRVGPLCKLDRRIGRRRQHAAKEGAASQSRCSVLRLGRGQAPHPPVRRQIVAKNGAEPAVLEQG